MPRQKKPKIHRAIVFPRANPNIHLVPQNPPNKFPRLLHRSPIPNLLISILPIFPPTRLHASASTESSARLDYALEPLRRPEIFVPQPRLPLPIQQPHNNFKPYYQAHDVRPPRRKTASAIPPILYNQLTINHRVRRSDLYAPSRSPSSSSSPEPERERETKEDPTLQSALHSRLTALYGPIPTPLSPQDPPPPTTTTQDIAAPEQGDEEQAFEFRLFSTPLAASAPQKIVLQPEEDDTSHDGFVRREREKSFYIAQPATGEQKERYKFAALSGDQVLDLSRKRAWGLEVPWRVVTLRLPSTSSPKRVNGRIQAVDKEGEGKETRKKAGKKPGKKRRVILRERRRKREGMEEAKRREREGREEAEREKRTRRNREKKVKRKMKEKAKKAGDEDGSD